MKKEGCTAWPGKAIGGTFANSYNVFIGFKLFVGCTIPHTDVSLGDVRYYD